MCAISSNALLELLGWVSTEKSLFVPNGKRQSAIHLQGFNSGSTL